MAGTPISYEQLSLIRALRGETIRDDTIVRRDAVGHDRVLSVSSAPVRDGEGNVIAAVNFFRDVTSEQKAAKLFRYLGQRLGVSLDPAAEMRVLADACVDTGGIATAGVFLRALDGASMELVGAHHYPADVLPLIQRLSAETPSIAVDAWRSGRPQVMQGLEDLAGPERALSRALAERMGFRSAMALPLLARGHVVGVLMLSANPPDAFTSEDFTLYKEAASRTAVAVDNALLYQTANRTAAELDAIINAIADGVWVSNSTGHLLRVNQAAMDLMGIPRERAPEAEGTAARDRLDAACPPIIRAPLARALEGETGTDYEEQLPDSSPTMQLRTSYAPITHDPTGTIVGAVAVSRDVSRLRALERMRDDFLGIVAHELRTPLTSLLGFIQVARRKGIHVAGSHSAAAAQAESPESARGEDLLIRMERQALRLNRLVGDLLDLVRLQKGVLEYRRTDADVAGAIAEAVYEQQAAHPERTIDLSVPQEPLPAYIDPDRIGQVVANLLTNALKSSRAEESVSVEVGRSPAGGGHPEEAIVRVRDAGPGIPMESQPHVFEQFYRVPGVDVQSGPGIGLGVGLYVAYEVVKHHDGRMWVEGGPGEGSTFIFTVPLTREAPDARASG